MIKVALSSSFKKVYKKIIKKNTELEAKFVNKLKIFQENPYHPSLRTHKLEGKLKHLNSFSLDYKIRVIFYFETNDKAVFINIGSHNQVY